MAEQLIEGIDPGVVPITPLNPQAVGSDQGNRNRSDIAAYLRRIQQWPSTHFFDTSGTGTGQPELAGGIKPLVVANVPFDKDTVVAAVDGVGDWRRHQWLRL